MALRSSLSGDAGPSRVPRNQDPRSFTADVVAVLRALRPGQVVTYGEVAAEAGHPGAARAVGNVLRVVTDVAWWRVVAASGRVNPNAVGEATRRLTAEGVQVRDGRVTASPRGRVGSAPRTASRGDDHER